MFIASKILALLAALLLRRIAAAALTILLVLGWQPIPEWAIRELESSYTEFSPQANLKDFVGVIVLGGGTEIGYVAQAHGQPLLTNAAERLTAPVAMLRRNPHLRLVYTGGAGACSQRCRPTAAGR